MATAKSSKSKYRVLVPYTAALGVPGQGAKIGDTVEIDDDDPRLDAMKEAGTIGDDAAFEAEMKLYTIPGTDPARYYVNASGALTKPQHIVSPTQEPAPAAPGVAADVVVPPVDAPVVSTPEVPPAL